MFRAIQLVDLEQTKALSTSKACIITHPFERASGVELS